jgi:hypothetical protein
MVIATMKMRLSEKAVAFFCFHAKQEKQESGFRDVISHCKGTAFLRNYQSLNVKIY